MSTALDLTSLAASGELKVPIARGVVSDSGSGIDYTGWSGVSSIFVEAKVEVREQSRGFATLTLTIEGSSNGSDWSTLETFTFGHGGIQSATVSSPPDHLRVSWAVGGGSEWQIIEVTAAPSVIDFSTNGGSQPPAAHSCVLQLSNGNHSYNRGDTISWDAPLLDTDSYFIDNPGTEITIPAGLGGVYLITFAPYLADPGSDASLVGGIVSTYNSFEDFTLQKLRNVSVWCGALAWTDVLPEGSTVDVFISWTGTPDSLDLAGGEGQMTMGVTLLGTAVGNNF